jgi:hypothetical protein
LFPDEQLPDFSWLDHAGTERVGNEEVFVTRPCSIGPSALNDLQSFLKQYGLEAGIYPGPYLDKDPAIPVLEIRIFPPQPRAENGAGQTPDQSVQVSKKV